MQNYWIIRSYFFTLIRIREMGLHDKKIFFWAGQIKGGPAPTRNGRNILMGYKYPLQSLFKMESFA